MFEGNELESIKEEVTHLGVLLDTNLNFHSHISQINIH